MNQNGLLKIGGEESLPGTTDSETFKKPRLKTAKWAFLLAVVSLFLLLMFPGGWYYRMTIYLFQVPLHYVKSLPWCDSSIWASMIVGTATFLACSFGCWFVVLWGWLHSSRGFKMVFGGCAVASLLCFWGLKAYKERIDWTSYGLNPDLPGFKPTVVVLAGTFVYRFKDDENEYVHSGTARFEIRMRGAEYYYAERWHGYPSKNGSWDALYLGLPEFYGVRNSSRTGSGRHGGGWSSPASPDEEKRLLVARRLWRGQEFIGAKSSDDYTLGHAKERFSELRQFGRFQIPMHIEWSEGGGWESFRVRRVEFLPGPDTNWFEMIGQKYFTERRTLPIVTSKTYDEAGWAGIRSR
jgi:energy-coupling factor transporter transmembrane protein EcfT